MSGSPRRRPVGLHALVVALLLQGMSGFAGGLGLIADPSGEAMGIPSAWLVGSPFADYLIPGLVLLTLLGIAPLAVIMARGRRDGCMEPVPFPSVDNRGS